MRGHRWWCLPLLMLAAGAAFAGEGKPLTLERVIAIARTDAPAVRVAGTRVGEARGGLAGARVFQRENPAFEGLVGPRWAGRRTTDVEASLSFPLELGGQRAKRVQVAGAELEREQHLAADTARLSAGWAVADYFRVLHAQRRLGLAEERLALSKELHRTAVDRQAAGDIARFEVNLADAEVARASSLVAAARADLARARADLAAALGLGSIAGLEVDGDLADRALFDALPTGVTGADRPDVRAAQAGVDVEAGQGALAGTSRWPELALRMTYAHEDDADVVLAGFSLTLPFFERGQAARSQAGVRRQRAEVELEARRNAVSAEVEGARLAYAAAVESVQLLDARALPLALENEAMARESYRAGKLDLAALLLIRRDALETRREHIDRMLEAALAGVDLWVAVGAP